MTRIGVIGLALALWGCVPDLGGWQVVPPGTDAARLSSDAGVMAPNPLDLGTACPNPHLTVGTVSGGRVIRLDPATGTMCRTSPLLELQRAFRAGIFDLDWHPETGGVLGLEGAVLGLDAEGFPVWRYEPFDDSSFGGGEWIVASGSGASMRIGVFWRVRSSSSLDEGLLLDSGGHLVSSSNIDLPFSGFSMVSAHPAGNGQFLGASRGGPIRSYTITDTTTAFRDTDGVELFTPDLDFQTTWGTRNHLGADTTLGVLAMSHDAGVLRWQVGESPPVSAFTCSTFCESYEVSIPGPNLDILSICAGSGTMHLVRMTGGDDCQMLVDGSSLGARRLWDLALVHAPL